MIASMVRLLALAAAVHLGCGDNLDPPPAPGEEALGGAARPPGCTNTLVTRPGATAPVRPSDVVGADPSVKQVRLGLGGDPRTSIAVTWRTADETTEAGRVIFGAPDALTAEAPGFTWTYRASFGNGETIRMHEAHLCGLTAGTEYAYQIVSGDRTSPVYRFRTAPDVIAEPDAEVIVASVGDSRDGYAIWALLVQQLLARTPDLVLFSGDAVTLGQLQAEWEEFFTVAEPLFATVPVVSVHGNHEVNAVNFYSQFAMPGDEENFSFDYGHAHVVIANDSPAQQADLAGATRSFLQADLARHAGARWKIVNHHRPIYSASTRHGSDLALRAEWQPVFDAHHVDLVLNGHEHNYERTRPMRGDTVQASPADGTIYVVSGGAGAELYGSGTDVWTELSAPLHSGLTVRVRRELLAVDAFDETGAPVDAFTIDKP